jgi:hypothetical protein
MYREDRVSEEERMKIMPSSKVGLFATSAAIAGVIGSTSDSFASPCACLFASIIRTVHASGFRNTAGSTWQASIPSDGLYGFQVSSAPQAFLDIRGNEVPITATGIQVCRNAFNNNTAVCGTSTSGTAPAAGTADISVSTAGTFSVNNSAWDYYFLQETGAASGSILGMGLNLGACG